MHLDQVVPHVSVLTRLSFLVTQVEALQAELDFQRSLYRLQVRHTEGLIAAIRQAYRAFQDNVAHTLCSPLQGKRQSHRSYPRGWGVGRSPMCDIT